jgi:predicted dehydrogenase
MSSPRRLRVGVIGCGGIAQIMHLPHLSSLRDLFEISALSDISPGVLHAMGERYSVPENARLANYQALIARDLDAVLVLTGGNHYLPALAALEAGKHVFAEKPLCYSRSQANKLIRAADRAQRKLMVGYMKRYDPGYLYAYKRLQEMRDLRYVQINTLHPAEDDYLSIHDIVRFSDVPLDLLQSLRETEDNQIREAVGDVSPDMQALYVGVFLSSMIHDTNALRGLLGEPERVLFAEHWGKGPEPGSVTTVLQYHDELRVVYTWTYLAELRDYFEEIAVLSRANRLRIQFPSPYLKHFPTPVVFQGMQDGAAFETRFEVSHAEAFKQELIAFYDCIVNDAPPLTSGADARGDIQLLQQIFAALSPAGLGGEAVQA